MSWIEGKNDIEKLLDICDALCTYIAVDSIHHGPPIPKALISAMKAELTTMKANKVKAIKDMEELLKKIQEIK